MDPRIQQLTLATLIRTMKICIRASHAFHTIALQCAIARNALLEAAMEEAVNDAMPFHVCNHNGANHEHG